MSAGAKGTFFAIGKPQWEKAAALGMNPAVALIVLARGSGRDNSRTKWSAEAIFQHTGMTWRRAKEAITALAKVGVLTQKKTGTKPAYVLNRPREPSELIWLPNEIVTGAGAETPPIARLRQGQDFDALRLFIDLYSEHDLIGDGGISRNMLRAPFLREKICELGQFDVYGFKPQQANAGACGPLKRFWDRKPNPVWDYVNALVRMGLLEQVHYLAESDDPNSELIHALTGDEHARATLDAANEVTQELPDGFRYECETYEFVLAVIRHMQRASVVGIYRLRYRPKTMRTAAWYAQHIASCKEFELLYLNLAKGQFTKAA